LATFSRSRKTSSRVGMGISTGSPSAGWVVCVGPSPFVFGMVLQGYVAMSLPRSVVLKLGRYQEHMEALEQAVKGFLNTEPYAATATMECDGTELVCRWERYQEPPDTLGLIVGDAIHNLRSSLDHMAVALAKAGAEAKGITMTSEEEARIQFPIVLSDEEFLKQNDRGRLAHVDPRARAFIEARQPYNDALLLPAAASPLYLLARIDNLDKHRQLPVAGLVTAIHAIAWPKDVQSVPLQRPTPAAGYEPGTEIGRFIFASPKREVEVPVEFNWGLTLWIGHWPNYDLRYMIEGYANSVMFAVEGLAQFLPG
jgi:hypothetical protein